MKTRHLLLLFAALLPIAVWADTYTDPGTNVRYEYNTSSGTARVSQCLGVSGDITILSSFTVDGKEYSVTSIEGSAFWYCSGLTSVTIPTSVTSIGERAFYGCSGLTSVAIPNSVKWIGEEAFIGTAWYNNQPDGLVYAGRVAYKYKGEMPSNTSVSVNDGTLIVAGNAFSGCSGLTSITIPNSVTSIGYHAFYGCRGLTSVTIPNSVTSIGENAFTYCGSLTMLADMPPVLASADAIGSEIAICVPSGALTAYRTADKWSEFANRICTNTDYDVTVHVDDSRSSLHEIIGEENLQNVVSLKITGGINSYDIMVMRNKMDNLHFLDLTDANIVASSYEYYTGYHTEDNILGPYSFYEQSKLVSVKLPKSITSIGNCAFSGCSNLREVELPQGLTTIGDYAFGKISTGQPCEEELIIPEGVTSIGYAAFANNTQLKRVALPSTLKTIGSGVFYYCYNLQSISLPTSLESIPNEAFRYCFSLTRVDIPSTITSIGDNAFDRCDNLTDVYTYIVEPTPINMNTFSTYTTATLHVPSTSYYNYWYDTEWSQFRKLEEFLAEYQYFYLNGDFTIDDDKGTINGSIDDDDPNADLNPGSGLIVETDEDNPQLLNIVHIKAKGSISASIIAASNMEANKVYFDIEITAGRWYFLSFPFNVQATNITAPGAYTFRSYNAEERANGKVGWQNWIGDLLEKGQGYIFQCAKGGTLSLCVEKDDMDWDAENRPQTLTAAPSADKQDASWNFIGNPQTSYFDIDETGYEQPITVWNGSGYDAVRAGDDTYALSPFEAFFVQKPDNQSAMEFPADGRYTMKQWEEAQTAKAAARRQAGVDANRLMVNIRISDGQTTDKTRVVFNQQKSKDYEMDCDAAKFMSTEQVPQLYSLDGRQARYAINERPLGEVPLGYKAARGGELTISAMRMDQPVRLRDTKLQITHDLSMGDYTFSTDAGTFDNRFVLTIDNSTTSIGTMKEQTGVSVMAEEGGIAFTGIDSAPADVYTVGGTLIAGQVGNGFLSLPKATYVVKVGTVTTKVMVR